MLPARLDGAAARRLLLLFASPLLAGKAHVQCFALLRQPLTLRCQLLRLVL